MDTETETKLAHAACAVRQHGYAPYSKFLVGAALVDDRGAIHCGCNVENGSYGLTTCAERNAVAAAVAAGMKRITGLAVASKGGVTPCGACRQVLAEFAQDFPILLIDVDAARDNEVRRLTFARLLPERFELQ